MRRFSLCRCDLLFGLVGSAAAACQAVAHHGLLGQPIDRFYRITVVLGAAFTQRLRAVARVPYAVVLCHVVDLQGWPGRTGSRCTC